MEKTKISIIIPVYNSEQYLERLFNSVLQQTYKNYEIIIINDGSKDNSLNIINRYVKENKNLKIIVKTIENSGPGLARKTGFEMATGDLLFFVDSDDYIINKDALKNIAEIYKEEKFDILFFDFIIGSNGTENKNNAFFRNDVPQGLVNNIEYLYKHEMTGALWKKIFVHEKMKNDYFYNSNNYEDYYTTYRYLNNCQNFYYMKDTIYYSDRDNLNSVSKTNNSKKIHLTVELLKELYDNTKFKDVISIIIFNYYSGARRRIEKRKYVTEDYKGDLMKIKELKAYFSLYKLIQMRQSIRRYAVYIYYMFKDLISRGK